MEWVASSVRRWTVSMTTTTCRRQNRLELSVIVCSTERYVRDGTALPQVTLQDLHSHNSFALFCRRTRSLNAPSPIQQFGPCGRIMKNSAMVM